MEGFWWTLISLGNHSDINVVTICVFAISSLLASVVVSKYMSRYYDGPGGRLSSYNMPPGPWAWPVVGNLPVILTGGQPHMSLDRLAREYGPVMSVSFGPTSTSKVVILSSYAMVKEVLVRNADATSDRRIPPLLDHAFSTKGSVIWADGSASKAHRRLFLTAFRKFIGSSTSFNATLCNSLVNLREDLVGRGASNRPFNPRQTITSAVSEVMCSLCFGHCLDIRSDPKIADIMRAMHEFSRGLSGISLAHIFPRLYFTPLYGKMRGNIEQLKNFLKDLVREHQTIRTNRKVSPEDTALAPTDIIDFYLANTEEGKNGRNNSVEADDIWRVMFDLLGAGTETTSETLIWGLLYLCLNPKVQLQVQSEIDNQLAHGTADDLITFDMRGSLSFTHATVLELLRCACVAPLSLPRITSSDVTITGYTIPRGTEIWVNEWAINRDENVWKNPAAFDPARFLDKTGNIDLKVKESVIAFGEGRRSCLGRNLAEIKLFTFLSNLLRWFSFRFPEDGRILPDVNGGNFGLVYSAPAFDVIITQRQPVPGQ